MQGHFQVLAERISNTSFRTEETSMKSADDLLKVVKIKAIQVSRKRDLEDLTLMELLNGFDIVVAERKPRSDIANSVYRLILRQERDKQRMSIQDLSQEI